MQSSRYTLFEYCTFDVFQSQDDSARMDPLYQDTTPTSNNILKPPSLLYHQGPSHRVRIFTHTSVFDPSRSKGCTGSHGSPCPSLHRKPGTLLLQRSAEHTLGVSALHTCANNTGLKLTMQRDGILLRVRVQDFVKPMLHCISAGFIKMFTADTANLVRDIGHIVSVQQS